MSGMQDMGCGIQDAGRLTPDECARITGGTFLKSHARCDVCEAHGEVCAWWDDKRMRTMRSCRGCLPLCLEMHSGKTLGTVTCGHVDHAPGSLTPMDMARACGLFLSFTPETCSVCGAHAEHEDCWKALDGGTSGKVTRVVCAVCLPAHFEKHLKEQAAMDAMVEAVPHEVTNDGRRAEA